MSGAGGLAFERHTQMDPEQASGSRALCLSPPHVRQRKSICYSFFSPPQE